LAPPLLGPPPLRYTYRSRPCSRARALGDVGDLGGDASRERCADECERWAACELAISREVRLSRECEVLATAVAEPPPPPPPPHPPVPRVERAADAGAVRCVDTLSPSSPPPPPPPRRRRRLSIASIFDRAALSSASSCSAAPERSRSRRAARCSMVRILSRVAVSSCCNRSASTTACKRGGCGGGVGVSEGVLVVLVVG